MQNNNDILVVGLSVTALMLLLCSFIVFFVIRYRQRQGEFEKEKERLKLQYERESNKAKLELSEQTMKNISQEIHDNVGQSLSLAKLQLNTLNADNLNEHRQSSTELITRAIQDLRNLSHSLNSNYVLKNGLEKSIRRELDLIEASGRIRCDFISELNGYKLSDEHEVILFRCVQETLNNALKYSGANEVSIQLLTRDERLQISIADNGKGFNIHSVTQGMGLMNIQNRAEILNGYCRIESAVGLGTKVYLDIPLHFNLNEINP